MNIFALLLSVVPITSYVDPFIGTQGSGHTTPAAAYPFGFLQPGPDTGWDDWAHCSGYQYADTNLLGFSQTHLSGTGSPDLGDMRLVLMTGEARRYKYEFRMDKKSERASVGYYAVRLPDEGLLVETTVAPKAAMYRITPEKDGVVHLFVDQEGRIGDFSGWRSVTMPEGSIREDGDRAFDAYFLRNGWVAGREVFSRFEFSHPFVVAFDLPCVDKKNGVARRIFDFNLKRGEPLVVRLAFSAKSLAAAKCNLDRDLAGKTFDEIHARAVSAWEQTLSRVRVEGTDAQKKGFYTSLYHAFFQPNEISDYGAKPFYSTLSCWDTFRALHPLYTVICPENVKGIVDSVLEQGRRTGHLPIWTLWGLDNQCMIGTHSVPIIVDWFLKESVTTTEYWESAYLQIKETLTKRHEGRDKENWDLYDTYGYYPFDLIKGESVSRTMECAYDDWCAGVMAEKLGHKEDAAFFFKRAACWKNVFDSSLGLVRGKDSKGNWRTPYDPYVLGHGADAANDFTEGNAFQYSWHVMQDVPGLVAAMGGREKFVAKLDSLFNAPSKTEGMGEVLDVTGLIGQYVHGNEPSHHVIYFYPQVGHPEKAAERIREVFDKFYLPKPDGLCGNDDCGQMSAWYLFSAMGFYPFNPCGGEYIIGAPQLPKVVLEVGGRTPVRFVMTAKNLSKENKYVKSVMLNGKSLNGFGIRHEQIMSGGELVFEMCAEP